MTKRIMFCLVLAMLVAGSVFAQGKKSGASVSNNAITMDMIPLFAGFIESDSDAKTFYFRMAFAYERLIAPGFSIGAELNLHPGKFYDEGYMYFSLAAAGRAYTISEQMEKFFVGAKLGFEILSIGETSASPQIGLIVGWREMFGKLFFVEPSMSYTYSMLYGESGSLPGLGNVSSSGKSSDWEGGLRIGVTF